MVFEVDDLRWDIRWSCCLWFLLFAHHWEMRLLVAEPESHQVLTSTADIILWLSYIDIHRRVQALQLNHLFERLVNIDLVDG